MGPSRKGKFDVSSFYKTSIYNENLLPLKEYLVDKGSFESGFFVWNVVLGKVLTLDNHRKRTYCDR